jgi:hypothetical protein
MMTDLQRVLAMMTTQTPKRSDTQASVRVELQPIDMERGEIGQVLSKAFAQVSRMDPPVVSEPMELLWRNAGQRRMNESKPS